MLSQVRECSEVRPAQLHCLPSDEPRSAIDMEVSSHRLFPVLRIFRGVLDSQVRGLANFRRTFRQSFEPRNVPFVLMATCQIPPEAERTARGTLSVVIKARTALPCVGRGLVHPEHDFLFGRSGDFGVCPASFASHDFPLYTVRASARNDS